MWAWLQRPLQPPHAHPDHPQSAAEVQVSGKGLQGRLPQPVPAQWPSQENTQERLEVIVSNKQITIGLHLCCIFLQPEELTKTEMLFIVILSWKCFCWSTTEFNRKLKHLTVQIYFQNGLAFY